MIIDKVLCRTKRPNSATRRFTRHCTRENTAPATVSTPATNERFKAPIRSFHTHCSGRKYATHKYSRRP